MAGDFMTNDDLKNLIEKDQYNEFERKTLFATNVLSISTAFLILIFVLVAL